VTVFYSSQAGAMRRDMADLLAHPPRHFPTLRE